MNNKALIKFLQLARIYCIQELPWFAPALLSSKIRLSDAVEVAAISADLKVFFNPEAIAMTVEDAGKEQAIKQYAYIWAHEIYHILREHALRAKRLKADAKLWNLAADLEINDADWKNMVEPILFPACTPAKFCLPNGQLAEWYYKRLLNNNKAISTETLDEGSGVHHQTRDWENEETDSESQSLNTPPLEHIQHQVQQLAKAAKTQGTLPSTWERLLDPIPQPQNNWRRILRRFFKQHLHTIGRQKIDYAYGRANRRQSVQPSVILPTLVGQTRLNVACVVDTSGSIGARTLQQLLAEVRGVFAATRASLTIIPCDTQAYTPIPISSLKDLNAIQQLSGGGGTDMRKGIEAALALRKKPDLVLVLTDGYTPFPEQLYPIPVLWAVFCTEDYASPPIPAPWDREFSVELSFDGEI